jgi:uncharacterized protein (TIGR02099 family)
METTTVTPETPHKPSGWLKAFALWARWLLIVCASVWVLVLGVWIGLHALIVPRIDLLRPSLERLTSSALGVSVQIGVLEARSDSLIPTFEARDVALLDSANREILRLPRVVATLSPQSVAQLSFDQLYIERPEFEVRRLAQGQWAIAGLPLQPASDSTLADWFFSQTEFIVRHGKVHWQDALSDAKAVTFDEVDLVIRNGLRSHLLRLDATPPGAWGERFSLQGNFKQPLLSLHEGRWQDWSGQAFGQFGNLDVSAIRPHLNLPQGFQIAQGTGWLRVWADIKHGALTGVTADADLQNLQAQWETKIPALKLRQLKGRLSSRLWGAGHEVTLRDLALVTEDGEVWEGKSLRLAWTGALDSQPAQGELQADQLDLDALQRIGMRLPLSDTLRQALAGYQPKGQVTQLHAKWSGSWPNLSQYSARAQLQNLSLKSLPDNAPAPWPRLPALEGLNAEVEVSPNQGKARLQFREGQMTWPNLWEEPQLSLKDLSADVQWQRKDSRWQVQITQGRLANSDMAGDFQLNWQSNESGTGPGVLDLTGNLSRLDARQVHRYLPVNLNPNIRHYVREAITQGQANQVKLRVRGDLRHFPFSDPKLGEFRIAGNISKVAYNYAPRPNAVKDTAKPSTEWPGLVDVAGELVFERNGMQFKNGRAKLQGAPNLFWSGVEARIPNFSEAVVDVKAEAKGPLADGIRWVIQSPVHALLERALEKTTAQGVVDYRLRLSLPLQNLEKSKVSGSLIFANNDLQITPDSPALSRVRGQLNFSETGFALQNAQARLLGGEARVEGSLRTQLNSEEAPLQLRIQGSASAEGVRSAKELGWIAQLGQSLEGSTSYNATFNLRRNQPEVSVISSLQGMAIRAPDPLGKTMASTQALRVDLALTPESARAGSKRLEDQIVVQLGDVLALRYVRDLAGPREKVLRGGIALGASGIQAAPQPDTGVSLLVNLEQLDVDRWEAWLATMSTSSPPQVSPAPGKAAPLAETSQAYLPTSFALQSPELSIDGRHLHHVLVGGSRVGDLWRATVSAQEVNGYTEYRPGTANNPARLYARLAYLNIPPSASNDVDQLLSEQPASIPALDIVVNDLELRGKRFGRAEVDAVNRLVPGGGREWRLNKFNLSMPEASFNASGNWSASQASAPKKTALDFTLEVNDSGDLLKRLGMPDAVRAGKGKLVGQVSWVGSPLSPDYPSMSGQFNVNIERGQFLKTDPGAARLLGVLNLQALPRRLFLDFRDVFSEGFAFDFFRGDVNIQQGMAHTNNLQMKGVNAAVMMEGKADIGRETQDLKVVIVPDINAGTASLVYSTINPVVGLTSFLAQYFLRRPLTEANTQEFHVDGTWSDPKVTRINNKPTAKP